MYFISSLILFLTVISQQVQLTSAKISYQGCFYHVPNNDTSMGDLQKYQLHNRQCLDLTLPYRQVTLPNYIPGRENVSIEDIENWMGALRRFEYLPKCWPKVQKLFCSVLFPRYDEEHSTGKHRISRPSVESCSDVVRSGDCDFIKRLTGWQSFLQCNDTRLYASKCINEIGDIRVPQTDHKCPSLLVPSNDSRFDDIEGCSLNCKYPMLDFGGEHPVLHVFFNIYLKILIVVGFIATLIALVKQSNLAQPSNLAEIIKNCIRCKFVEYCGWSLQLLFETSCSTGGLKLNGFSCLLSFLLTYTSLTAYLFWLTYFSMICYKKLRGEKKKSQDKNSLKILYCHLVLVALTFMLALLGQVESHGPYGICTLRRDAPMVWILFDFIPTLIGVSFADFHFFKTWRILRAKAENQENQTLSVNFIRITALAMTSTLDVIIRIIIYIYVSFEQDLWMQSIVEHHVCEIDPNISTLKSCTLNRDYTIVILYYLELFTKLAPGIIMATWALDGSNDLRAKGSDSKFDRNEYREIPRIGESNGNLRMSMRSIASSFASAALPESMLRNILNDNNHDDYDASLPDITSRDVIRDARMKNSLFDAFKNVPSQQLYEDVKLHQIRMLNHYENAGEIIWQEPWFTLGVHRPEED